MRSFTRDYDADLRFMRYRMRALLAALRLSLAIR